MNTNKIWWAKIFLSLAIFNGLVWAKDLEEWVISGRKNGIGFQAGSLRSIITFKSNYMSYEGTSFYSLSGIWFKLRPLPAIFLAFNHQSEIEGSRRFFLYVPIVFKRKALFEFEMAYLKGFKMRDLNSGLEVDLRNFESARILGSLTFFLNPKKFSWKHAFNFGERQTKSGGTWAVGGDLGLYSFNTGRNIPLILNDSSLILFRQLSMLFADGFFGGFYNLIIKTWYKKGKTKILGLGGSLLVGISMQAGSVTVGNKEHPTGRIELLGFTNASAHLLYTTDRWVFRVYVYTRKHQVSPAKLLTIENRWSNAAFQIIYLFGKVR